METHPLKEARVHMLERVVGYTLRCNFYCLDCGPPADMNKGEVFDVERIWSGKPHNQWGDDACATCGKTLGEVNAQVTTDKLTASCERLREKIRALKLKLTPRELEVLEKRFGVVS